MTAAAVIRSLLVADTAVTAAVPPSRIVAGLLPQGGQLPALAVEEISAVPQPTIDAQAYALMRSRVQVTVVARNYPEQKAVAAAVRDACQYQHGLIAGVQVASIVMSTTGPDLIDGDAQIYQQPVDFIVIHHQ